MIGALDAAVTVTVATAGGGGVVLVPPEGVAKLQADSASISVRTANNFVFIIHLVGEMIGVRSVS
jgi:hypothetical protein